MFNRTERFRRFCTDLDRLEPKQLETVRTASDYFWFLEKAGTVPNGSRLFRNYYVFLQTARSGSNGYRRFSFLAKFLISYQISCNIYIYIYMYIVIVIYHNKNMLSFYSLIAGPSLSLTANHSHSNGIVYPMGQWVNHWERRMWCA